MSSSNTALGTLLAWLRERSTAVSDCEQKAFSALYDNNNEAAYRELMKKKASLLASIAGDAASLTSALSSEEKERIQGSLDNFSANAQRALSLNSIFYMSALLYPDDHHKGEPNNLQKFIASLSA